MKDRRIGKFYIDWYSIDERPEHCRAVLRDCIVLRAESMHHRGAIEYHAINPAFDVCEIGDVLPEYDIEITTLPSGGVKAVKWVKRQ